MKKNRKSFVWIIVLITVIAVIYIAFNIMKNKENNSLFDTAKYLCTLESCEKGGYAVKVTNGASGFTGIYNEKRINSATVGMYNGNKVVIAEGYDFKYQDNFKFYTYKDNTYSIYDRDKTFDRYTDLTGYSKEAEASTIDELQAFDGYAKDVISTEKLGGGITKQVIKMIVTEDETYNKYLEACDVMPGDILYLQVKYDKTYLKECSITRDKEGKDLVGETYYYEYVKLDTAALDSMVTYAENYANYEQVKITLIDSETKVAEKTTNKKSAPYYIELPSGKHAYIDSECKEDYMNFVFNYSRMNASDYIVKTDLTLYIK